MHGIIGLHLTVRRWVRILEAASGMLATTPGTAQHRNQIAGSKGQAKAADQGATDGSQGVGGNSNSSSSDTHEAMKKKKNGTTTVPSPSPTPFSASDAQALLDEASAMQPYVNAPGEHFSETMRAVLGELMMVSRGPPSYLTACEHKFASMSVILSISECAVACVLVSGCVCVLVCQCVCCLLHDHSCFARTADDGKIIRLVVCSPSALLLVFTRVRGWLCSAMTIVCTSHYSIDPLLGAAGCSRVGRGGPRCPVPWPQPEVRSSLVFLQMLYHI